MTVAPVPPKWLPELVLLEAYEGHWPTYLEAIYAAFRACFVTSRPVFQGRRLALKVHPIIEGKEATFWHFITEGPIEAERIPNMRRCERIPWPGPIIDRSAETCIKVWSESGRQDTRIHLWLEAADYLVVLADRGEYLLPWTAFHVDRGHYRRNLQRRFERATGQKGAGATP